MLRNKIMVGHNIDSMSKLPAKSVDVVVTSPPYWNLRDYGTNPVVWGGDDGCAHEWVKGIKKGISGGFNSEMLNYADKKNYDEKNFQITPDNEYSFCKKCDAWRGELGSEPTPELFVEHLCEVFDAVKRVLKDTGTAWVNIGDSYSASGGSGSPEYSKRHTQFGKVINQGTAQKPHVANGYPKKSLVGVPFMFAMEMIRRGWALRNTIIWHKNNVMPSPHKDRFTIDFEYLFLFVKNTGKPLFYVNEELGLIAHDRPAGVKGWSGRDYFFEQQFEPYKNGDGVGVGKNKRTVWNVNTKPFKGAHFATFPRKLVKTPISAGCPEFVCQECGLPRVKYYSSGPVVSSGGGYVLHEGNVKKMELYKGQATKEYEKAKAQNPSDSKRRILKSIMEARSKRFAGYLRCLCDESSLKPGIVMDPFGGSGTVAIEAMAQGKDWLLCEINEEYAKIARERIKKYRRKHGVSLNKWLKR